jgi:hypothetical protein
METGTILTAYMLSALVAGVAGAAISSFKNRYTGFWTAVCFLLPPAVLILFFLPKRRPAPVDFRRRRDPDNLDDF